MGLSKKLKEKFHNYNHDDKDRLIRLGWEDRSTFESIEKQFNLTPNEFIQFMRFSLDSNVFKRWRKRTSRQGQLKQESKRGFKPTRFKCSRQSIDGITKGWK